MLGPNALAFLSAQGNYKVYSLTEEEEKALLEALCGAAMRIGGMRTLGAILYDPAVAVLKSLAALQAMTAFDTVNLRQTVTVPAHGMLRIQMNCNVTGVSGTIPAILFGVMNGATVVGRSPNTPRMEWNASADFTVTGLAPGPITLDAAFSVEILAAGTSLRYGGPNNAVTNDAGGGFSFVIIDPAPQ